MSEDMLLGITKPLMDKYPNTYTFTKSLAEQLLHEEASDLPLIVIRPSVVSSTLNDPVPVSTNLFIQLIVWLGNNGFLKTASHFGLFFWFFFWKH